MNIPQPNRSGDREALCFMAICPSCSKLVTVEDGRYPDHLWDETSVCPTSGRAHVAIVTVDRRAA